MAFTVAIAGRPNVGKSTLFNRLTGKRAAIVDDTPGVTRDWREGEAQLLDLGFRILDTAGLDDGKADGLGERIQKQTRSAIEHADALIFVIDGRDGVTPADKDVAKLLRKSGKPVLLAVNKADTKASEATVVEAERLGFGEPIALSAAHGTGLDDLYRALIVVAPDEARAEEEVDLAKPLTIAITGRPNAGKSTLLNRLIGKERSITGPEAGITRDAVAAEWSWEGRKIRLVDTAGLRRKAKVSEDLEKLSVADALEEIKMAEVVILVIDADIPFETQDLQIADLVEREGRALVIGLNKWDLIDDKGGARIRELREEAARLLPQLRGAPVIALSGATGQGIDRLMQAIMTVQETWNRRISTSRLNRWLEGALEQTPPPAVSGRRIKIRYITQPKARPPHFVLFGNQLDELPTSYERYLVNSLREYFDLPGVPLRLSKRMGENPYEKKRR